MTHQQNGLVSEKTQGRVSSGHVVGTVLQQEASEPMLSPAQAAAASSLSFCLVLNTLPRTITS